MLNSLSALIVTAGGKIFVVGFLGCYGVIKDNKCVITISTLILVILFIITILPLSVELLDFLLVEK